MSSAETANHAASDLIRATPEEAGEVAELDGNFCGKKFNKERVGWYAFDWANSTFATLGISMIIPVMLAALAEAYAYSGDSTKMCHADTFGSQGNQEVFCADPADPTGCTYFGGCQCRLDTEGLDRFDMNLPMYTGQCHQCMMGLGTLEWNGQYGQMTPVPDSKTVTFMGFQASPFAFTSLVLSISVVAQAIVFIAIGPFADFGGYRKSLMMIFSTMGAVACALFMAIYDPSLYWLGGILTIVANVCFGCSIVFYNAFMPLLSDVHADVKNAPDGEARDAARDTVQNTMSLTGFGAGYVAGFIVVLMAFPLVFFLPNTAASGRLADRICMLLVGVWWLGFSLITAFWLKKRPGPPLPAGGALSTATLGFRNIWGVLKKATRYPNTFRFLIAFFFYSDGVASVPSIGILFGQIYMCMGTMELLVVLILNVLFSAVGCWLFAKLTNALKWNAKSMLLLVLCAQISMIAYMAVGLFQPYIGLWNKWEFYAFGVAYGLLNGAWQSYSRVIWADFSIPGHEAEFFSLFEITDRGSSWLTPMITAVLADATGNLRYAFLWVLAVTILPALLIKFGVNYEQGKIDVGRVAGSTDKAALKGGNPAEEMMPAPALEMARA